jgi:hypothetical protein
MTAAVILVFCFMLPLVMGVISAWNDAVSNEDGRCYTIRSAEDLIITDPGATEYLDCEALVYWTNESAEPFYAPHNITWGTTNNTGYQSIDPFDDFTDLDVDEEFSVYLFLNYSLQDLTANDSTSLTLELRGLTEDCGLTIAFRAYPTTEGKDSSTNIQTINSNATENMTSDATNGAFTTITIDWTQYDLLKEVDDIYGAVGASDNYLCIKITPTASSFLDPSAGFLDFRFWFNSPNGAAYISGVLAIDTAQTIVGVAMIGCAIFATPWFNLTPNIGMRSTARHYIDKHRKQSYQNDNNNYNNNNYRPRKKFGGFRRRR